MRKKYKEYKTLSLSQTGKEIRSFWEKNDIFHKSVSLRQGKSPFVFYEGPPSANGMPGIHHVMARAIKDIFCRYKTQKGFLVERKGGWDTHGLPVEIGVEKKLNITKEDIGKKISIASYNSECRKDVMKYKAEWDELTKMMGYWVDLDKPYITFENNYIETLWYLLKQLFSKDLLYKGYSIQPYSPAAGTGLSTHELNQPGCYRNVKDTSAVAQFKIIKNEISAKLYSLTDTDVFFLAWTTTPWTLPSNTGLAVGPKIEYLLIKTFNPYTHKAITIVVAKDLYETYFPPKNADLILEDYTAGDQKIPYKILGSFKGKDFENMPYEQLLPYAQPSDGHPFRVVLGDFVTTEDGTGIVHIAPSFGADDFKIGKTFGLGSLTMVDKQGRFVEEMGPFAGRYVKSEFAPESAPKEENSVDVDIVIKLKKENKAFKVEKYEHSYPHCWRTDKPILYYPLDAWFIRTTALKEKMIALNKTINWKPESTGIGRFGNWLENLMDWNLSRSRYWGTPLPIWSDAHKKEFKCIGSIQELKNEAHKAVEAGLYTFDYIKNVIEKYRAFFSPEEAEDFNARLNCIIDRNEEIGLRKLAYKLVDFLLKDLHRPYVDDFILLGESGQALYREPDLIDVWFDSGAMPYAQWHYPFENNSLIDSKKCFPADFIAEGVDQTRGWFFTLHAIAVMLFDDVAFKTVVSNGLVLDKFGNKMSKRWNNTVDPFETIKTYGPDATRWYMITNAQPWDNLKFDIEGIAEVQRKFFGTLHNTYNFFALYANIDGFTYKEKDIPYEERTEIDRWILSELNTLIKDVDNAFDNYEPAKAGRLIQHFTDEYLSNWYVRLCRRRFWKGDYSDDKIAAYQTLYTCLDVISRLSAPISPFFMDRLFGDLNSVTGLHDYESVHLTDFPKYNEAAVDKSLEERMQTAQKLSSMLLALRKKSNIRVRQPLSKILIPVLTQEFKKQLEKVENLILSEVNVKKAEYLTDASGVIVKSIKPNFKTLGPRYGKIMKQIAHAIKGFDSQIIETIEKQGTHSFECQGQTVDISLDDVIITTEDVPGWLVASDNGLTVALDITITPALKEEGIAREIINRIQQIRKDKGFEVTDKISIEIEQHNEINDAINNNNLYICTETLAEELVMSEKIKATDDTIEIEVLDSIKTNVNIKKIHK